MPGHRVGSGGNKHPVDMIGCGLVGVQEVPAAGGLLNQVSRGKLPTQQERNIMLRYKTGYFGYLCFTYAKIDQLRGHTAVN